MRGDHVFYHHAMSLERGQLMITDLDYGPNDGGTAFPERPVIRAVHPLFMPGEDEAAALLVINLSADALLDQIQRSLAFEGDLIFYDPARDYALLFNAADAEATRILLADDPSLAERLQRLQNEALTRTSQSVERDDGFLYGARELRVGWSYPARSFLILSRSSDEPLMRAVMASLQILGTAGLSFAILAALVAGLWGAAMARPISHVANAIDRFAQGDKVKLPTQKHGEIGRLINSVRQMRQQVDERTEHLRMQIARSKQLENERMLFHERLTQSQKLEAIGSMAGGLAHDFNNLLTAVFGFAGLLSHSRNLEPNEREWLEHIFGAARRGRDLIRRVLTFSRQSDIDKRQLHLAAVMRESVELLRASIPTSIRLEVEVHSDEFIVGDETQLSQVILNLGTNASHAVSPTQGEIIFKLEEIQVDQHFCLSHPELSPGRYLVMTVRDNGEGIPRERQARVFEPFFTTKPVGEGTGLGLAVVHGIVRSHQGTITVRSEEGKGTAFHTYLPVQSQLAVSPETPEDDNEPLPELPGKILVVDDEESICSVVSQMLSARGYQVETCSNGVEALATFLDDPDAFSLIITDQTMPEMTGDQLIVAIRQRSDQIPIILASGYSSTLNPRRVGELSINQVLLKPYSENGLLSALRSLAPARSSCQS